MKYYLLKMLGDVEPELEGPFATDDEVLEAAKRHRVDDPGREDGLFLAAIDDLGDLAIVPFAGWELEEG
jgi:hypothetical protein